MKKQRFELIAGKSAKFWEVDVKGSSMTTWYGRIGTKGQSTTKEYPSAAKAKDAAEKLIKQKTQKGYEKTRAGKRTKAPVTPKKTPARKKAVRKITKSERDAKKLLAAAARLEREYPELEELSTTLVAVRPRYKARLKKTTANKLNRKASLIGGTPFLTKRYPAPLQYSDPDSRSGAKIPMAPLLQLDLDEISKTTGESFGKGLLQVWMRSDAWGSTDGSDSVVRIIPHQAVITTKRLLELPERPADAEIINKLAEIDPLRESDPDEYEETRQSICHQYHYDEGTAGFDWTGSVFAGEFDTFESNKTGAPLQIVGWEPDGYTIPGNEDVIWYVEREFRDYRPDELKDEPDFVKIREVIHEHYDREISCSLFELEPEFESLIYMTSDEPPVDRTQLWRPLVTFAGPLSDPEDYTQDKHAIFYRRIDDRLEYCHQYYRWNG